MLLFFATDIIILYYCSMEITKELAFKVDAFVLKYRLTKYKETLGEELYILLMNIYKKNNVNMDFTKSDVISRVYAYYHILFSISNCIYRHPFLMEWGSSNYKFFKKQKNDN